MNRTQLSALKDRAIQAELWILTAFSIGAMPFQPTIGGKSVHGACLLHQINDMIEQSRTIQQASMLDALGSCATMQDMKVQ